MGSYATKIYKDSNGDRQVIDNGGIVLVKSGGSVNVQSGGSIDLDSGATLTRSRTIICSAGAAKAGATAGWAIPSAHSGFTNAAVAGLPASQTGSTLMIPLSGYKSGDTITAFRLVGQLESAGNTVTVDCAFYKLSNEAAGDITATSLGSITQISAVTDQAISSSLGGLTEVVTINTTYYAVVTATTGASTDIQIMGVRVTVTEA